MPCRRDTTNEEYAKIIFRDFSRNIFSLIADIENKNISLTEENMLYRTYLIETTRMDDFDNWKAKRKGEVK